MYIFILCDKCISCGYQCCTWLYCQSWLQHYHILLCSYESKVWARFWGVRVNLSPWGRSFIPDNYILLINHLWGWCSRWQIDPFIIFSRDDWNIIAGLAQWRGLAQTPWVSIKGSIRGHAKKCRHLNKLDLRHNLNQHNWKITYQGLILVPAPKLIQIKWKQRTQTKTNKPKEQLAFVSPR